MRTTKAANNVTITYYYDNGNLVAEHRTTDSASSWLYYLYGVDGIAGFRYNSTTYLFRKNIQGDVTHIYTESGTLVGQYAYAAWGNCAILQDANGIATLNPFRYRGYYFDQENDLYYLQSRYYDPATCRFVNADDISYLDPETIGGLNLYAYCGNNPVMGVDPEGTAWWHWIVGIAIIAALALATIVTAGIAGVGIGTAFAAGFAGAAIGTGASGALVTIMAGAFAGAVIGAGTGIVSGALIGGFSSINSNGFLMGALEGASMGFMSGAITGAIFGGIKSAITYAKTTPLLRSVSADELASVKSTKAFSSNGTMESKWFATNKTDVSAWAQWFKQNDYIGIRVPKSVLTNPGVYFKPFLDGIGPAYCIDIDLLNTIIKGLWFF